MHELSIARALVEVAGRHARAARAAHVRRLNCRIGTLTGIEPELLRAAFEVACQGSPCASAALTIESAPPMAVCPRCDRSFAVRGWHWDCPDCGVEGRLRSGGDELELISIEAEAACPAAPQE